MFVSGERHEVGSLRAFLTPMDLFLDLCQLSLDAGM